MDDQERSPGGGEDGSRAFHPIGVVARRTGLSLHVLRAWERRYGVVEPVRTAGGQRLYSDADIGRLRLLRAVTEAGHNISRVAALPSPELERLVAAEAAEAATQPARPAERAAEGYRARCLAAAERLDGDTVHATLMRAMVSLRPQEFMTEVLMPLLHEVGERWHEGRLSPAQEHVVSMSARRVVSWLLDAYDVSGPAPVAVVTTVAGEQHEFGALMVSVLALEAGWRVVYLGPSLPAAEVAGAARRVDAELVALSMVNTDGGGAVEEAVTLRAALPVAVPVVLGGAGAAARRASLEAAGVTVITGITELVDLLRRRHGLGGGVA
jgi:MerR family transcriptional regulator, light-induced transcriptional regulator